MNPLCIYHGGCFDGFTAAWAVRQALPAADFHAGIYQDPPPDVAGKDVIIVDFSYKRPVLEAMALAARTILVLDHHKTAAEDLAGLRQPDRTWSGHLIGCEADTNMGGPPQLYALFDMERSGAGMAWDYFHPGKVRPALIDHVEDRDLWRFKLAYTREIHAAMSSYPFEFEAWDDMMATGILELHQQGRAVLRKHWRDIETLIPLLKRRMVIGGHDVPVANIPIMFTSDTGHTMAKGEKFAACYWDTPEGRVFSLRSTDDGLDVSEIAKGYGGGGHRNAAGFRMPRSWEGDA